MTRKNPLVFVKYRGEYPVKNFKLARARVSKGLSSEKVAGLLGLSPPTYRAIENLRVYPDKELRERISKLFGEEADCLFPQEVLKYTRDKLWRERGCNEDVYGNLSKVQDFNFDSIVSGSEGSLNKRLLGKLEEAFSVLSETEMKVIGRRFGLDGKPCTLEEIEAMIYLTRERVRQIESEAVGKLRRELSE